MSSKRSAPLSGAESVPGPVQDHETALRDRVYEELRALVAPGGPLASPPLAAPAFTELDLILMARRYRADSGDGAHEGAMAVVTAGPPGAGKSTHVANVVEIDSYRRIDPDEIKDLLLEKANERGMLSDLTSHVLADGAPVLAREVSGWFHHASTEISKAVLRASLRRGENVLVEGTLQWFPLAEEYAEALLANEYKTLTVIDVEVPCDVAKRQARTRWWTGRLTETAGGRFLPDEVIDTFYESGAERSRCAATADDLWARTWDSLDVVEQRIEPETSGGYLVQQRRSRGGQIVEDNLRN